MSIRVCSTTLLASLVAILIMLSFLRGPERGISAFSDASLATTVDASCVYDQTSFTSTNRIVMYYAPWCTFCSALQGEFESAAAVIAAQHPVVDVCFVTVNADAQVQGSSCQEVKNVKMFPTVQLEIGSDPVARSIYNGVRNSAGIVAWVNTLIH